jgi:hypothetical protein
MVLRGKVETAFPYTNTGYLTTEELQRYKRLGFNCISLQYFWDYYQNSDGSINMENVRTVLDPIIERCEAEGIQVILNHRTTWGLDPRGTVYTESWLFYGMEPETVLPMFSIRTGLSSNI